MRRQARLPERPSNETGRFIKDATNIVTAAAEQRRTVYISRSFAGTGSISATIVFFVTCPNDVVHEMQYAIDQAVGDLLAEHGSKPVRLQ